VQTVFECHQTVDHNGGSHWVESVRELCSRTYQALALFNCRQLWWGVSFGPSQDRPGGREWEEEGPIVGLPGDRGYVYKIIHPGIPWEATVD